MLLAGLALAGCGGNPSPDASEMGVPGVPVYGASTVLDADADQVAEDEAPPPPDGEAPVDNSAMEFVAVVVATPFVGLEAADVVAHLNAVVQAFHGEMQRIPTSLEDLVAAGFLDAMPATPEGKQFVIMPEKLEVALLDR